MTKTEIATTITALIREAGLDPANYAVQIVARAAARIIDETENYGEEFGISEADIWEGLAADNWTTGTYPGHEASEAAYAIADSLPGYGRTFWAAECKAAARRNEALAA